MLYGITSVSFGSLTSVGYINPFGLTGYQYVSYSPTLIIIEWAIIIISMILSILLLYTFYGSILGKVNKLSIHFDKSLILFAYWLVFYIVTSIILLIIGGIFSLVSHLLGSVIVTILNIIFVNPALNLILILKAEEF